MAQRLPLNSSAPIYRVSTSLAGTQYVLDVRWNGRDEAWYMDVLAEDESPIRRGIKCVLGTVLGWRSTDPRMPGPMVVVDTAKLGRDATIDDLGTRVQVIFHPPSEL